MFDWFKKDRGNVVNFPTPYVVPPIPVPEEPATIFYRIGVTDKNRVAFSMGMSEITMTRAGINNMIQQLEVFRDQLTDEETD